MYRYCTKPLQLVASTCWWLQSVAELGGPIVRWEALQDAGGEKAVAPEWIKAIHDALARIDPETASLLPSLVDEEE